MKKGQITVFMIIALVLLLMTAIILVAISRTNGPKIFQDKFDPIQTYIQGCHEQVADDAINLIALQGGYIDLQGDYLITPYQSISYQMPDNEDIILEINSFIEQGMLKCLDFSQFQEQGYEIILPNEPKSTTTLYDKNILFTLDMPIRITLGDETKNIQDFQYNAKVRLGHVLGIMKHFLQQEDWMDLTESAAYDININILTYNNELIYNIEDPESMIQGKNLNFLSARRI